MGSYGEGRLFPTERGTPQGGVASRERRNPQQKGRKVFKQIAQELKPEAAYFFPQGGERGGLIVVDMTASSQIVEVAERFFFGLNAKVEMMPVMALEDLERGLSSIEGIVQRYG
jgi:hypothetical protein